MTLLADLVDHLEHGHGRGHPVEVLTDDTEGVHHLDLVDGVEIATSLPAEQGNVAERLEPGPELRGGAAHALGHRPDLAVFLGHQRHDPVRLAEADGAQHHATIAKEGHRGGLGSSAVLVPEDGPAPLACMAASGVLGTPGPPEARGDWPCSVV